MSMLDPSNPEPTRISKRAPFTAALDGQTGDIECVNRVGSNAVLWGSY